jgi:hypothetical protein
MKSLIFLTGFSLAISTGCSDSNSTVSESKIQRLFPLNAGNEWRYHAQKFRSDGTLRAEGESSFLITGQTTFLGLTAYTITIDGDTSKHQMFYYSGSSDFYAVEDNVYVTHLLHYPININEPYILKDTVYETGSIFKRELVLRSTDTSITVSAGKFTCIHFDVIDFEGTVNQQDTNGVAKQYYSPGVGLILEEDYGHDANFNFYLSTNRKLTSYVVK